MDRMHGLGWRAPWLFGAVCALGVSPSAAQPVPSARMPIGSCVLRGRAAPPKDLLLWDAVKDGRPIARFTGVETQLAAFDLPQDAGRARVRVRTGAGVGGFRLDGFVDGKQLPLSTAQRAAVVDRHVGIEAGQSVELLGTASGRIRVRMTLQSPLEVSVSTTVPCRGLTLGRVSAPAWSAPPSARGYVLRAGELALYESPEPRAASVLLVRKNAGAPGVPFWSSERRSGWIRVEYHRGIVIDAWAKSDALSALGPGETLSEPPLAENRVATPNLLLDGNARLRRAANETPIRTAPRDNAPVIGAVEAESEVYVIDLITGWASVLPKALNLEPYGDGKFWVEAKALGF